MAVVVDPSSLIDSVMTIAGKMQKLGNNYLQASDAWEDFPSKVDALCTKLNVWQNEVNDLGLSWDETVVKRLGEAEKLLRKEEEALQKRRTKEDLGRATGFFSTLKMTVFPARIDRSIRQIKAALDNILQALNDEREIPAAAYKRALARKPALGFQRDNRYVRLHVTEELIKKALMQAGGPKVVLLHGGTGRGKSCLVRDVALQVEPSRDENSLQQSDLATSSGTDPNHLANVFDKVVYIECGEEAQIPTIQLDLRRKLGREDQALMLDDQKAKVDSNVQPILKGMLQNKRILIIFDDVWSQSILQNIIGLCGRNVKCLVTSQVSDLCRPLNCIYQTISMEKISSEDARKILASHILGHEYGVSDEMYNIPDYLQILADEIICKVDANPLAIACVATAIHPHSFQDERVWQKVIEGLSDSLNSVDTAMIHNSGYPCSFWVAIQLSVEKLTKEERKFFVLVSSCRGPSVPEEVVEYIYKLLKAEGFSQFFLKVKKQLKDRQLIQVRESSWSIHTLLQEFVDRNLLGDKASIMLQLKELSKSDDREGTADSGREVNVVKAIMKLYLDDPDFEFTQKSGLTMHATRDTLGALDKRRYVIEPVTRLLLSDLRGPWSIAPRSDVREVFLAYVKAGFIHKEAAITLLQSSNSKCIVAMTDVLIRFAQANTDNNVSVGDGVVYALLNLLGDKDLYKDVYSMPQNDLLTSVARAVYWLQKLNADHAKAFDFRETTFSTSFSSALEEITTALAMGDNHLRHQALTALRSLSAISVVSQKIATPRVLGELSKILINEDDQAKDGKTAAIILGNVTIDGGQQVCQAIVSIPTALQGLLNGLTRDGNPQLQVEAAWALAILADKGGKSIALRISGIPGTLESLVHALTKASYPELRDQAATTLADLALAGGHDLCVQIADVPTALQELIHALKVDTNFLFQAEAARALEILADKGGQSIALRISRIPESLERFVHALSKTSNPQLQKQAACALAELAFEGGHDLCVQISAVPTALPELIRALRMETNPELQIHAARALAYIANKGGESIALKISRTPESLERLVHALTKVSNPKLQMQAARVLAELAFHSNPDLSQEISNNQGSFPQLTNALGEKRKLDGQSNSALIFSRSVPSTSELHLQLAESTRVTEGLVVLANDDVNSPELHASAMAIRALALIDPSRGRQIRINSAHSYAERGYAELLLGLYRESLEDLNVAWRIQPQHWNGTTNTLRRQITVKAKLRDLQGALIDANSLIEINPAPSSFQERGVLKCMMGDLPGALMDLDEALLLDPDDYECLKHRGYVKFLMEDGNGARADAEKALDVKPSRVDFRSYGRMCLGVSSVEYMGFKLR